MSLRRRAPLALAAAFTASGIVHLVRPQAFASIMPRAIPEEHHTNLIYASGLAELVCAAGLVRRSSWAPAASVAMLAAVFPANVQMALDAGTGPQPRPCEQPRRGLGPAPPAAGHGLGRAPGRADRAQPSH